MVEHQPADADTYFARSRGRRKAQTEQKRREAAAWWKLHTRLHAQPNPHWPFPSAAAKANFYGHFTF